jgi:hypothetical protein
MELRTSQDYVKAMASRNVVAFASRLCYILSVTNSGAYILRETTGTNHVAETLRRAVELLAHWDIPHWVVGGLAVQEHGYYRVTIDVDIVVPDVLEAYEFLTADLTGPFERLPEQQGRLRDRSNGVLVDLLPAQRVLQRGCRVPFPTPDEVSPLPRFITLEQLISLKLDSWLGSPARRLKDKADVTELILARNLPRDLNLHPSVRAAYEETWDALKREGPGPRA